MSTSAWDVRAAMHLPQASLIIPVLCGESVKTKAIHRPYLSQPISTYLNLSQPIYIYIILPLQVVL